MVFIIRTTKIVTQDRQWSWDCPLSKIVISEFATQIMKSDKDRGQWFWDRSRPKIATKIVRFFTIKMLEFLKPSLSNSWCSPCISATCFFKRWIFLWSFSSFFIISWTWWVEKRCSIDLTFSFSLDSWLWVSFIRVPRTIQSWKFTVESCRTVRGTLPLSS